jgi:hypothetical protein
MDRRGYGCDSSGRAPAYEVQGPPLSVQPAVTQKKKKRKEEGKEGGKWGRKEKKWIENIILNYKAVQEAFQ